MLRNLNLSPDRVGEPSAFAPLKHRVFRVLWIATILGNIGTWVRDVASGWAMTELSPSPLMVALVQAFGTLPLFLLALPAGALADLVNKRRLLILVQFWLLINSLALALSAATDVLDARLLLLLTLSGGIGAALLAPAWQAIVPELVSRKELRPAVALNSLGVNIARAIGPALGGLILSFWGLAAAYGADVASYVVTALALLWWRRENPKSAAPPEHLVGAMGAGLRYAFASPELQRVMLRAAGFFLFATAVWALLPVVARNLPGASAGLYGIMLGAIGLGAIGGALALPRLRLHWSTDAVLRIATVLVSGVLLTLAFTRSPSLAILMCLVCGAGWILALSTLGATVQSVLPDWVRGRGLAIYLTVFYGSMTLGSVIWGQVASGYSLPVALASASVGGALAMLLLWKASLPGGEANLTPARPWPDPVVAQPPETARGPVCVTIEYRIDPARGTEFLALLRDAAKERRRNGAYQWAVYEDVAQPGAFAEVFLEPSWAEHERHHQRVTTAEADLIARIRALHIGTEPPRIRHLLAR